MTRQEQEIIDAAILWALCPDAGSYRQERDGGGGASVEDTCERLAMAVRDYLGKDMRSPPYPKHWTIGQMKRRVRKQLSDNGSSAPGE